MDPTLGVIAAALVAAIITPIMSTLANRGRVKVDTFAAFTAAQTARIDQQDREIAEAMNRIRDLEVAVSAKQAELEKERGAHAATRERLATVTVQLAQMKDTVRRYFEKVAAAWPAGGMMPRPDAQDLVWLSQPLPEPALPTEPETDLPVEPATN